MLVGTRRRDGGWLEAAKIRTEAWGVDGDGIVVLNDDRERDAIADGGGCRRDGRRDDVGCGGSRGRGVQRCSADERCEHHQEGDDQR